MWGWGGDIATPDYNFDVHEVRQLVGRLPSGATRGSQALANAALAEPNFKKRVALLHQAERIELEASPYIIYSFTPSLSVTRNGHLDRLAAVARRRRPAVRLELAPAPAAAARAEGEQQLRRARSG